MPVDELCWCFICTDDACVCLNGLLLFPLLVLCVVGVVSATVAQGRVPMFVDPQTLVRPPCRATEEQFAPFVTGMRAVLNQWTALLLVGAHCDPNALPSLFDHLVQWFLKDGEVYSDELEIFFEDFFNSARSVLVDDDSMKEVADALHDMYCRCCAGDFSQVELYTQSLENFRRLNPVAHSVNGGDAFADDGADDVEGGEMEDEGYDENEEEVVAAPPPPSRKKGYKKSNGWNIVM